MKILCISASNVIKARGNSTSTKVCELIKANLEKSHGSTAEVDIISLIDFDLKPCVMCGECEKTQSCIYDEDYNEIFQKLKKADGILIVCPHYAPIPSKLMVILEKLQEFAFLSYCSKTFDNFVLRGKRVCVIGHGGMNEGFEEVYTTNLLNIISNSLSACGMKILGIDERRKNGVVFGIEDMKFNHGETLPYMIHNWKRIEESVMPLVYKMAEELC